MYHAKENGKARHAVFGTAMAHLAVEAGDGPQARRRAVANCGLLSAAVWLASGRVSFEVTLAAQERGLAAPGNSSHLRREMTHSSR